jgi:hypothetical protein
MATDKDPLEHIKAYNRTSRGKAKKRELQDEYRSRKPQAVELYESTEERKARVKEDLQRRRRQRVGKTELFLWLRLDVVGGSLGRSLTEFEGRWFLTLCRDRRRSVALHRLSSLARSRFLPK